MGFCFFNNIAIAAAYANTQYKLKRVAIVDFDVHHGNGTEDIIRNKIKSKKNWTEGFELLTSYMEDLTVVYEFFKEGEASETDVEEQYEKTISQLNHIVGDQLEQLLVGGARVTDHRSPELFLAPRKEVVDRPGRGLGVLGHLLE